MATPHAGHAACPIKQRLIRDLSEVHKEIALIHGREIDALLGGDLETHDPLVEKLRLARERRADLARELEEHSSSHRC